MWAFRTLYEWQGDCSLVTSLAGKIGVGSMFLRISCLSIEGEDLYYLGLTGESME